MEKKVFTTRMFEQNMKKADLHDADFLAAIDELNKGLHDGDLGGNLFKKRVQTPGQGKRGGYRVIIATKKAERWFFIYGFKKNAQSTLSHREEEGLKIIAKSLLGMSRKILKEGLIKNKWRQL